MGIPQRSAREVLLTLREADMTRNLVFGITIAAAVIQPDPPPMELGNASHIPQILIDQKKTDEMVEMLMKSSAAIESEKDPEELYGKMADYATLLIQLQATVLLESNMTSMTKQRH